MLAVIWALLTYVFPPDPNTVVASEAITTLQQLSFEQRWEEALTTIEEAKAQLTQPDAELLIWEGVVRDKLGQSERSLEALEEARALVPADQQVAYLWSLGAIRLYVNDLEEARIAGNEAVSLEPSNPQGYFLLASVAEMEGDTGAAVGLFEEAYQLATESNPQLAVIARVRMGSLLQRPANMSLFGEDQPEAGENGENEEAE